MQQVIIIPLEFLDHEDECDIEIYLVDGDVLSGISQSRINKIYKCTKKNLVEILKRLSISKKKISESAAISSGAGGYDEVYESGLY